MGERDSIPILLPKSDIPVHHPGSWRATKHLKPPEPQLPDDTKAMEMEAAAIKQGIDTRPFKKVRPRRTVDYMGGVGRWNLIRKFHPDDRYTPQMRPAPPYVVDLLPPRAYSNLSTSLCTRFIHTSTNKIRCPVNVVTWTPEGRRVLTGSTSGEFTLWNGLTFNFETILQAHDTAIRAIQFSHSGSFIASADQTGIVKYFQPNMNNLKAWNAHREAIRGLSFSPDDAKFVTASDDSTVRLWDFEESREERVFTGHNWDVKCVDWHPTKGLLVSGSKDNLIKFWDPRTGTCLSTLYYHKNTIQALAWSPGGEYVASASRDQTVRLFDIRAMKEYKILKGHKKEANSLAWHPVHPLLVSGGSEGSILHWDITESPTTPSNLDAPTITPRARLDQAHDSNVWSLSFHPLGHLLVSASNDHTARFWSRERPGDTSSDFSGGGVRPPKGEVDVDGQGDEDEEDAFVPGLGFGFGGGGGPGVGNVVSQHSQQPSQGQGAWAAAAATAASQPVHDPILPPGFVPLTNGVPSGPPNGGVGVSGYSASGGHSYGARRHGGYHQQPQPQVQTIPTYNTASLEPGGGSMDMDDGGIPGFGGPSDFGFENSEAGGGARGGYDSSRGGAYGSGWGEGRHRGRY